MPSTHSGKRFYKAPKSDLQVNNFAISDVMKTRGQPPSAEGVARRVSRRFGSVVRVGRARQPEAFVLMLRFLDPIRLLAQARFVQSTGTS